MLTDYHSHILPGIDDGADCRETSLAMLEMLKSQGVERVVATPHFYAHREKSVERFLEKRSAAFNKIKNAAPLKVLCGAEVAVEHNISELSGLEKLAVQGTDHILLELPYRPFENWMSEEIYHVSAACGLKVILAHVHRYTEFYSKEQMEKILSMNVIFQINQEAFKSFSGRRFVKKLISDERQIVFGSDCHNLSDRRPDWNLIKRKCRAEILDKSNQTIKY